MSIGVTNAAPRVTEDWQERVMETQPTIDRKTLDALLHTLPAHVLVFDGEYICRYAAPNGDHFLGCDQDDLLGRPIEGIFPPEIQLRPHAETVLQTAANWRADHVPYPAGPRGAWPAGAWTMHAQLLAGAAVGKPVVRGRSDSLKAASVGPAVMVSCFECACNKVWAHAGASPQVSAQAIGTAQAFSAGGELENRRAAALAERVRTKLTVIRGFAQLLRRRLARTRPTLEAAELDRISDAIRELDVLLGEFEDATR